MTPSEIEVCVACVVDALAGAWIQAGREPVEAARSARQHIELRRPPASPLNRFQALVVGGEPIGTLWFEHHDARDGQHFYLVWIEIGDEHRGSGHGRTALDLLEESARELDVQYIELSVFIDNAAALRLYDGMGYVEVESHPDRRVLRKTL